MAFSHWGESERESRRCTQCTFVWTFSFANAFTMHCAHYAHYALAHYAHNAHLSEHFSVEFFLLCTKTIHILHRWQSTFTLHSSNVQQCVWTWWMWDTWREWQFNRAECPDSDMKANSRFHPRLDSSGNTVLWQMGWVKLLGSSSHLRLSAARIFQIQGSPCGGSVS